MPRAEAELHRQAGATKAKRPVDPARPTGQKEKKLSTTLTQKWKYSNGNA